MSDIQFPANLSKIIDILRKKGVKSIEIDGLKLELHEEAPPSNYKRKLEAVPSKDQAEPQLTEEDWLLWSTQQEGDVSNG